MARPRKDVGAALALVAKDLLENNQSVADIGVILGCLGEDSAKWLADLKKECTSVAEFVDAAKQRADIALIAAAVKAAMGYKYEEIDQNYIKVPAGYDDNGQPRMREVAASKKVKIRHARENDALLKFILKCRLPEYFTDVQKVEINKKVIEIKEITQKEIESFAGKLLESVNSGADNGQKGKKRN